MILGKKNTDTWFSFTGLKYWTIYQKGKTDSGNPSYKSTRADGVTHTDAVQELQRVLNIIGHGQYTIIAHESASPSTKGNHREDFEISVNESNGAHPMQAEAVSGTPVDVKGEIKRAMDEYKRELEVQDLRKKLDEVTKEKKELEKSSGDPLNKFIGAISPYTEHIVRAVFPGATAAVAGVSVATDLEDNSDIQEAEVIEGVEQELTPEQTDRLSNVVTMFAKHDTDWLGTLERMAAKLESNPQILNMIKSFI